MKNKNSSHVRSANYGPGTVLSTLTHYLIKVSQQTYVVSTIYISILQMWKLASRS